MPNKNINHSKQTHSGEGDNITGNKVVTNIKVPFKPLLFTAILVLVIIGVYKYQSKITNYFGNDKIFKADDTQFKVLIIPFKVMCQNERNKDIGLHIKERLVELNRIDDLNLYPFYYDIPISKNFDADSAQYLRKYHNADQIIYGNYYDEKCSETDGDEVCYNWQTDEKWGLDSLQNNLLSNSNYQTVTVQDLRNGKIQGSTDYIIYWIAGLNAFEQNHHFRALRHWTSYYCTF